MKVQIRIAIALAATLLTACNTLTHTNAKKQAEQQWRQVRARVKFQLAEQQYLGRLFEEAAHTVAESLALDPKQADAYVVLARASLELSRIGSAQQALDAARAAGLESPDLIYTQGVIFEQQGRIQAALERYAEAQSLDETDVDYLVATAECLVATGRAPEALSLLDEYAHQLDDSGTVSVLAAHVAALTGDTEGATQRLAEAVVPPASRDMVAQELGILLARSGRCDQAVAILQPLLAETSRGLSRRAGTRTPGGAVRRALAACYLTFNDPAAARDTLVDYAQAHPDDTLAQLLLAKAAVATDDMLTALCAIDLLKQHEPNHPEVRLLHAVVQWRRGNLDAAAASLQDMLTTDPQDVEAHCLFAEILLTRQRPEAARTHFEQALRIDPDCTWALAGLKSSS
ncbi:MAG: tetratricopeptide repeat protein [Planctomycetota bacterium]|jgi:Tfp pilus assembly protein PilF